MLPPDLQTPREVTLYYDSVYHELIESGQAAPFLYPWAGLGAFLVIGYLLLDHRHSQILNCLRYPVFAAFFAFQTWVIATNRAKHPAGALGVGLLSAWGIMWVATIIAFNDCQTDFVRIERRSTSQKTSSNKGPEMNGHVPHGALSSASANTMPETTAPGSAFYWQSYPETFGQRLDWVADLFCSFRGVGWNFQAFGVPRLPQPIEAQLSNPGISPEPETIVTSRTGIRRFNDRATLLAGTVTNLIIGYLVLDFIKMLMHHDAYFWGYMDASPPAYLPTFVQHSHFLVKSYRLLISLSAMYTALWEIFKCGPPFFCGLLGPKWIGVRGEPWINPADMFGSFHCVLDYGLAGWWGGWWHQTFRIAFEAPTVRLLEVFNIDKKSETGRTMSLFIAFFFSGCLHAAGSYTQLGDTRPLMGPMRFFMLQPFGILLQAYTIRLLHKAGVLQYAPNLLKKLTNFVFVHAWMYHTAPLLVDDFAKGGIWLFEPAAVSPLRALGLGAKDDTWFAWWDGILFWWPGKGWWDTGIAL